MNKILIIGGTNFIGRNLIERLMVNPKYELTMFNRGITNSDIFPNLKRINGDRNTNDVTQIRYQEWDYIIDLSGYHPNSVSEILNNVNTSLKRYIFISSCSAYDNEAHKSVLRNEIAPICSCSGIQAIDQNPASYGARKAECERRLVKSGLSYSVLRPALVYGRYDNTERFYYWLYQIKKNKDLLISNNGEDPFSLTYVGDLVNTIIALLNPNTKSDVYNITSTPTASIRHIIDAVASILDRNPKEYNASAAFLIKENISEWTGLPLWLNCDYFTYSNRKLINELGIKITEFTATLTETIEYFDAANWPAPTFGLTNKRKTELIEKLKGK